MTFIDPHVFSLQLREQQRIEQEHSERLARRETTKSAVFAVGDPTLLAAQLERAKIAHTAHEAEHGPDPDWAQWYAEYLLGVR